MSPLRTLPYGLVFVAIACSPDGEPPQTTGNAMWFEGARLIVGDGGAPVESSAFLVEESTFTWVGRQGEREPPEGAARVDLRGKTVIPALIDAHQHIGLTNIKDGTSSTANYTRENLIEHLERSAYHGVAATMSLGLEFDEALAFQLRDEVIPNAAHFLTSGRGIAGTPMAGPQQAYRLGIPRGALTEAEGRAAVRELHANNVDLVKVWVDDRGGTVPKVEPNVYRAIIDEAHARGMRVVAHLGTTSALEDAKDLLRAGIDGFAHTIRDRDIDEEYMALVRQSTPRSGRSRTCPARRSRWMTCRGYRRPCRPSRSRACAGKSSAGRPLSPGGRMICFSCNAEILREITTRGCASAWGPTRERASPGPRIRS